MLILTRNNEQCKYPESNYDYCEFKYPLDDFQKNALSSIYLGHNVLVCAATGNGKTSVAIAAIQLCVSNGKRVLYTAPIKALLNQKYSEFKQRFGDVGIETGDVKINPHAQCVVMTTEILRNKLMLCDTNVMQNVGIVIFDEVHYIKDPSRGNVWETCIQMLDVQQVMLSATIHEPERFANWIIQVHPERDLHLIEVTQRKVPLEYYCYKDQETLVHIMDNERRFNTENYIKCLQQQHQQCHVFHKLNQSVALLHKRDLFPATYFVMSKKNCEMYATKISVPLVNSESATIAVNAFNKMLLKDPELERQSLQVQMLRDLVAKGIGIHHAGLNPLLKEIIEELYSAGYLKILFATGTFTVGLNMPIRTVVLSGLTVYSEKVRFFTSDEFIQMCGRAGRRGLDTKGYVILCPLNEELPALHEIKSIATGHADSVHSKLEINKNLVIDLIANGKEISEIFSFVNNSLHGCEVLAEMVSVENSLKSMENVTELGLLTANPCLAEYIELENKLCKGGMRQNQIKKTKLAMERLIADDNVRKSLDEFRTQKAKMAQYIACENSLKRLKNDDKSLITKLLDELKDEGFIDASYQLTPIYGKCASQINGYDKVLMTKVIFSAELCGMSTEEIGVLFSHFINYKNENTDVSVSIPMCGYTLLEKLGLQEIYTGFSSILWQWLNGTRYGDLDGIDSYNEGNFITQMNLYVQLLENIMSICESMDLHILFKQISIIKETVRRDIVVTQSMHLM